MGGEVMTPVKRRSTKKGIPTETSSVVLSVSPIEADQVFLEDLLSRSEVPLCPGCKWTLLKSSTLSSAMPILLGKSPIGIVLSDCDSLPLAWRELLDQFEVLPHPPLLILTTRLADERFWAKALNLG